MANVSVKIEGVTATNAKLQKQHEEMGAKIKPVVMKYTKDIVIQYREVTPVGPTGNLRKAVGQKLISRTRSAVFISGTARSIIARSGKKGYHRHLVAYGSKVRQNKKGANRGTMPENRKYASVMEKVDSLGFDRDVLAVISEDVEI